MAKDPAFLFYYQDWLIGTYFMKRREKGAYMDLLCYQADKGRLTLDDIKEILNGDFDCWDKIKDKFVEDNGLFYNKRLDLEKTKRANFTDSRRKNVEKRYSKSTYVDTSVVHMENENRDINKDIIKEEDIISKIWIKTWSRSPKIPEIEETDKLIKKFGPEKVERAMREASLSGFKNFKTFVDSLDDDCQIKPKDKPDYLKKIESSTYKTMDSANKKCENDCGQPGKLVMKDSQGRSWRVCSRKCFDEVVEKNKNAFQTILRGIDG